MQDFKVRMNDERDASRFKLVSGGTAESRERKEAEGVPVRQRKKSSAAGRYWPFYSDARSQYPKTDA